ncbi:serine/threonine-protein kinase [Cellulomonas soli]
MTARREASAPPHLPGYTYVRVLGLGGFADVFLYEQELPRREVAVKVLLAGSLDDQVRTRFQTEANLMAQLSHHPSIVTIHQAAIASDGRPYLVMEYCSRPGLAERYRQERISVAEALRIGIRLSSAVETAHRAGILHRDIKPANVLTTDFGWPALTDFGIAATTGHGGSATVGMSIPWSPPELLGDRPTGDERSDVYSLGATIYSLLAGRTPFELPGAPNGAADLVGRIERMPLPPTGRDDVPPDLHDVLVRAMEKHPSRRLPSAAAVARALQQVEAGLRLPATPWTCWTSTRPFRARHGRTWPPAGTRRPVCARSCPSTRRAPARRPAPPRTPPACDRSCTSTPGRRSRWPARRSRSRPGPRRRRPRAVRRPPTTSSCSCPPRASRRSRCPARAAAAGPSARSRPVPWCCSRPRRSSWPTATPTARHCPRRTTSATVRPRPGTCRACQPPTRSTGSVAATARSSSRGGTPTLNRATPTCGVC